MRDFLKKAEIGLALTGSFASALALTFLFDLKARPFVTGIVAAAIGAVAMIAAERLARKVSRKRPRVFISYAHDDTEFATDLAKQLASLGAEPLMDVLHLKVGDRVEAAVGRLMDSSDYVTFIISRASKKSVWTQKEIQQALKHRKRILPVVLDTTAIPPDLSGVFYADFTKDKQKGLSQLAKSRQVEAA